MKFSHSKLFLYSLAFFILGIVIASYLPKEIISKEIGWFLVAVISFVMLFAFNKKKFIFYFLLFIFSLTFGAWRYSLSLPVSSPEYIYFYNNNSFLIEGIVKTDPVVSTKSQKFTVKNIKLSKTGVGGGLLVITNKYPKYAYGDKLAFECEIKAPEPFEDFLYDRYLSRHNIYSVCFYPKNIERIKNNQGNSLFSFLYKTRKKIKSALDKGLNPDERNLAFAMFLGDKTMIGEQTRANFSHTGLSHLAAISGTHIGVFIGVLTILLILAGIRRSKAFVWVGIILAIYILLIGAPPSAIRAGIMGAILMYAYSIGRLSSSSSALVFAAATMLMVNPKLLRDDLGFQLSFLALLGIINYFPFFQKIYSKIKYYYIRRMLDMVNLTISAQLLILPIVVYRFKVISFISPITNLLVLWTLPFLIGGLIFGSGVSILISNLSWVFLLPAEVILKYINFIARFFGNKNFAFKNIDNPGISFIILYYFIVMVLFIVSKKTYFAEKR